jgi:hypothetical protein
MVSIDDLTLTVAVSMGDRPIDDCLASDHNADVAVTIDEVVLAVDNALHGCGDGG